MSAAKGTLHLDINETGYLFPDPGPWSLCVSPDTDGHVAIYVTISQCADLADAIWHELEGSPATATDLHLYPHTVRAIKCVATIAPATVELRVQ